MRPISPALHNFSLTRRGLRWLGGQAGRTFGLSTAERLRRQCQHLSIWDHGPWDGMESIVNGPVLASLMIVRGDYIYADDSLNQLMAHPQSALIDNDGRIVAFHCSLAQIPVCLAAMEQLAPWPGETIFIRQWASHSPEHEDPILTRQLIAQTRKPSHSPLARILEPLASRILTGCVEWGLNANNLSFMAAFSSLIGIIFALSGQIAMGVMFMIIAAAFDHFDGRLARLMLRQSYLGEWFSLAVKPLQIVLFLAALWIGGMAAHFLLFSTLGGVLAYVTVKRFTQNDRHGNTSPIGNQWAFGLTGIRDWLWVIIMLTCPWGAPFALLAASVFLAAATLLALPPRPRPA